MQEIRKKGTKEEPTRYLLRALHFLLPALAIIGGSVTGAHWSFYATLNVGTPVTPTPTLSVTPAKPLLGLHQVAMYGGDDNPTVNAAIIDAQYTHAQISRGPFSWRDIEPTDGSFSWTDMDNAVNKLTAAGIPIVGTLTDTPSWANGGSSDPNVFPWTGTQAVWDTFTSRFAVFAGALAAHYKGKDVRYEILNEPGGTGCFWNPSSTDKTLHILRYGQLFTALKNAILAQDPSARISIGGLTNLSGGNNVVVGGTEFVNGLMQNGVTFDYLTIHPYGTGDPGVHLPGSYGNYDDTVLIYNTLQANPAYRNVKLWITEVGDYDATTLGQTTQANYMETIFRRADSGFEGQIPQGVIQLVNYFIDRDQPGINGDSGIFTASGTPKQAADRMRDYIISR